MKQKYFAYYLLFVCLQQNEKKTKQKKNKKKNKAKNKTIGEQPLCVEIP